MSRIVYIRYRDHVLFRNADPSLCRPVTREGVGWVVKENLYLNHVKISAFRFAVNAFSRKCKRDC